LTHELENEIDFGSALTESAQIMYVTLNGIFALHEPESNESVIQCAYCSALAKDPIFYPCPTAAILLSDMVIEENVEEEA
jgi:hypothetical protein